MQSPIPKASGLALASGFIRLRFGRSKSADYWKSKAALAGIVGHREGRVGHRSGNIGEDPVTLMVVLLETPPTVDQPCRFK